jgi:hypothetical protein
MVNVLYNTKMTTRFFGNEKFFVKYSIKYRGKTEGLTVKNCSLICMIREIIEREIKSER